ncbi:MAG: hypothetical protein AMXMBFR64_51520 [Myxococcales bacterium]
MSALRRVTCAAVFILASLVSAAPNLRDASPGGPERLATELRACSEAAAADLPSKCRLYGKIQWVDAFPDVKVQIVDAFPDIKVKFVSAFPDRPGTWQVVDAFPDFKVQKVSAFPDYKIQIVDAFPGCD